MKLIDMTNAKFGRLTVVQRDNNDARGQAKWRCLCACGVVVVVYGVNLRKGHTKSCGCLHDEVRVSAKTTHGGRDRPEYEIWSSMKKRCGNQNHHAYSRYGGRGIAVCVRWGADFAAFLADVGPRPSPKHSLDRINNDGNYEPGNVRWATASEQAKNRRPRPRANGRFS
jgi:hypothetical protein